MKPKEATNKLLIACAKAGITKVVIGIRHELIKRSVSWPFPLGDERNIFTNGPDKPYHWPPIWGILDDLKISCGAGNSHQHQFIKGKLIPGAYHFKNKKWEKIDD